MPARPLPRYVVCASTSQQLHNANHFSGKTAVWRKSRQHKQNTKLLSIFSLQAMFYLTMLKEWSENDAKNKCGGKLSLLDFLPYAVITTSYLNNNSKYTIISTFFVQSNTCYFSNFKIYIFSYYYNLAIQNVILLHYCFCTYHVDSTRWTTKATWNWEKNYQHIF